MVREKSVVISSDSDIERIKKRIWGQKEEKTGKI